MVIDCTIPFFGFSLLYMVEGEVALVRARVCLVRYCGVLHCCRRIIFIT